MLIITGFWFSPGKLLLVALVIQTKALHWKKDPALSAAHSATTTCDPKSAQVWGMPSMPQPGGQDFRG